MLPEPSSITRLLQDAHAGRNGALEELVPLIYGELRGLAQALLATERAGHTLGPTALVHEAWLRFAAQESLGFEHRAQFFAAAATTMRRVLVDHARRRGSVKRGAGERPEPLDEALALLEQNCGDMNELGQALESLAVLDARKARLVELRFFAGLDMRQAADLLSISLRQAERDWMMARAFLKSRLSGAKLELG